jgi:hypothetical protein
MSDISSDSKSDGGANFGNFRKVVLVLGCEVTPDETLCVDLKKTGSKSGTPSVAMEIPVGYSVNETKHFISIKMAEESDEGLRRFSDPSAFNLMIVSAFSVNVSKPGFNPKLSVIPPGWTISDDTSKLNLCVYLSDNAAKARVGKMPLIPSSRHGGSRFLSDQLASLTSKFISSQVVAYESKSDACIVSLSKVDFPGKTKCEKRYYVIQLLQKLIIPVIDDFKNSNLTTVDQNTVYSAFCLAIECLTELDLPSGATKSDSYM